MYYGQKHSWEDVILQMIRPSFFFLFGSVLVLSVYLSVFMIAILGIDPPSFLTNTALGLGALSWAGIFIIFLINFVFEARLEKAGIIDKSGKLKISEEQLQMLQWQSMQQQSGFNPKAKQNLNLRPKTKTNQSLSEKNYDYLAEVVPKTSISPKGENAGEILDMLRDYLSENLSDAKIKNPKSPQIKQMIRERLSAKRAHKSI
jgi:hypothetical protein